MDEKCRVKVHPSSLSDHHLVEVRILNNQDKPSDIKRSNLFMSNTSLLNVEDCNDPIFILRELNKLLLKDFSAIERWNRNVSIWSTPFQTIGCLPHWVNRKNTEIEQQCTMQL